MGEICINNVSRGEVLVPRARWCASRLCRMVGLQFHRPLQDGEGLLMKMKEEGVGITSIHMFFVFFPIAAIWINNDLQITSAQLAKPWRPFYASPTPARYVLETTIDTLERVSIGDQLEFPSQP